MIDEKWPDNIMEYAFLFGQVAIKKGFITEQQLEEALDEQLIQDLTTHDHKMIGTILFEKGLITYDQITIVLDELVKNKKTLLMLPKMLP